MSDLVSKQNGDGSSPLGEFPDVTSSRFGTERQEHEACLGGRLTPVTEDLGLTQSVQGHDRLTQERQLTDQDRRRFRAFRQLLLQSLVRLQTPATLTHCNNEPISQRTDTNTYHTEKNAVKLSQ